MSKLLNNDNNNDLSGYLSPYYFYMLFQERKPKRLLHSDGDKITMNTRELSNKKISGNKQQFL
jgi:hypothetical protein